jgi:hypothetical protein
MRMEGLKEVGSRTMLSIRECETGSLCIAGQ